VSFLSCGTPTETDPVHIPPLPSSAVKDISYTLPSPSSERSALICAVSVPTPSPSGDVSPSPVSFVGSSCVIPSIVRVIASPSGSCCLQSRLLHRKT